MRGSTGGHPALVPPIDAANAAGMLETPSPATHETRSAIVDPCSASHALALNS